MCEIVLGGAKFGFAYDYLDGLRYAVVYLLLAGYSGEAVVEGVELYYYRVDASPSTRAGKEQCQLYVPQFQKHNTYEKHLFHQKAVMGIAFCNVRIVIASIDSDDISIVTQMSVDRFSRLSHLSSRWAGRNIMTLLIPLTLIGLISVAVYIRDEFELLQLDSFLADNRYRHVTHNVDIHLLFSDLQVYFCCFVLKIKICTQPDYPINVLRNLALDAARTKYVISLDVDFLPNVGMHAYLMYVLALLYCD